MATELERRAREHLLAYLTHLHPEHDEAAYNSVTETVAALQQAQQPSEHTDLRAFYSVQTDAELIAAQARHIERLQAKLPSNDQPAFTRVREG